jgi:4'-phosphopantetheinyl transferase
MPLYKSIDLNSQTNVKVWKISESIAFLLSKLVLTTESLERVSGMKSELHQRAFLSVRMLLEEFGYLDSDMFYDSLGKPFLKDGKHISISHSYHFSTVVISTVEVGIDIEKQRPKIIKIASKFIGYESFYLNEKDATQIQKLTWVWCTKEALYKLFGTPGMIFKTHFMVLPFSKESNTTTAWIVQDNKKLRFIATFMEFEGFGCVITEPNF